MYWLTSRRWINYLSNAAHAAQPESLVLPECIRVQVFAPHADDETFGCGGTLALLRERGCHVKVVVVTDGAQGDPEGQFPGNVSELRNEELTKAMSLIQVNCIEHLSLPDGKLDAADATTREKLVSAYDAFKPDWVFAPSPFESHRDHLGVFYHILSYWANKTRKERLFLYEVWGGLTANRLVDITSVIERKREMIRAYRLPLCYYDYESAMMGLASYRGLVLAGANEPRYAEAFLEVTSSSNAKRILKYCLQTRQTIRM